MRVSLYTQCFSQRHSSSVQYEESPKHCNHVEDDIAQKWTRSYSKRLDQRHAASNYCSNKYPGSWKGKQAVTSQGVFKFIYISVWACASLCLPNKAPTANPAVCGWENAAMALKMSGAPLPRARNVTPWSQAAVKENILLRNYNINISVQKFWASPYFFIFWLPRSQTFS